MDKSIFRFILRYSAKQQLVVVALTLISWPVLYATLELPKSIVNEAIGNKIGWAMTTIGQPILGDQPDKVSFLLILCGGFLFFVIANGVIKFFLNVYAGRLGEQMLRRLRFQLYSRVLRFPLPHFKKVSQGEIIPMITAEVEPLGGYIGIAMSTPMFFGGMLLVYLGFIFAQDVFLGLAAVALYPAQIYVIPKLQAKVIALGRRRVREVRSLADKIGESIGGVTEIHAHDTSVYERADITRRLDRIYLIRYEIFRRKFAIKFLNSFMAQLTPFFFYSIGGYFVIKGQLSIGALVAVLAAYKDLSAPWKELLNYYQLQADVKVKYEQVIEQFDPPNMLEETLQDADDGGPEKVGGEIQGANVTYSEDGRVKSVEGANFAIDLSQHVAIVGAGGSGKDDFTLLLARLIQPTGGQIRIGEARTDQLPEAFLGRRIAYMSATPYLFSTSVRDNLTLRPAAPARPVGRRRGPQPLCPRRAVRGQSRARPQRRLDRLRRGRGPIAAEALTAPRDRGAQDRRHGRRPLPVRPARLDRPGRRSPSWPNRSCARGTRCARSWRRPARGTWSSRSTSRNTIPTPPWARTCCSARRATTPSTSTVSPTIPTSRR